MIGSIVLGLSAKKEVTLRGMGGEVFHGLLFSILRRNSSEFVSKLHNQDEQKPFSIFPLLKGDKLREGRSFISPGEEFAFKLTALNEEMLSITVSAFLPLMAEGTVLRLSGKPVTLENMDLCREKFTSFPQLLKDASAEMKITLEFTGPTAFKSGGVQVLFPEPKLVFTSLLRRWKAFSEINLPQKYAESFTSIKVSNYDLHTQLIPFSKYKIIGFKGKIAYELPQDSSESFRRAVNALADFASYGGVGVKTAMGMGQTKRIKTTKERR